MLPDYYSISKIDATTRLPALNAVYRHRAVECQPDGGGRHEVMVLVSKAWQMGDLLRRQRYDAECHGAAQPQSPFNQHAAAARSRAAVHSGLFKDFKQRRNEVAKDFGAVEWTTTNAALCHIPVSKRSAPAKIFATTGAIVCSPGYLEKRYTPQVKSEIRSAARLYGLGNNPVNAPNSTRNNFLAGSDLPNTSGEQAVPS